jgi:hypothetical protein
MRQVHLGTQRQGFDEEKHLFQPFRHGVVVSSPSDLDHLLIACLDKAAFRDDMDGFLSAGVDKEGHS